MDNAHPANINPPRPPVHCIGAGLAGAEASWQLARQGIPVVLTDMKPLQFTPAHHSPYMAELVCSNSLRGDRVDNAPGLLKAELRRVGSLIMACADGNRVKAGGALAVDREAFARAVTEAIMAHPLIETRCAEMREIPQGDVIVATGPLTSDAMAGAITRFFGGASTLFFYDAAAPLILSDSVDMRHAFWGSRYGRGSDDDDDYLNCPLDREGYLAFRDALCTARQAPVHGFEDGHVFEGCLPVEVLARRGEDALRYGPLRPVGLRNLQTGQRYYAVLQLRRDNAAGDVYNLVGCQTHLTFSEQRRVFGLVPALRDAEFLRYGVMHRNTYLDSPRLLTRHFEARREPRVSFAGQMTGVEGYVESAASGFLAGVALARKRLGLPSIDWPGETALGALAGYISNPAVTDFQPMNINFGLLAPIQTTVKGKQARRQAQAARALGKVEEILTGYGLRPTGGEELGAGGGGGVSAL